MSFQSPWLLFGLLALAGAVGFWILVERRRARYAVRFTNLDVLATVVSGRSWPRLVPPALFALSLAFLLLALARPHVERMVARERATVVLVVDTSRSMQARDVQPTRLGAAQAAIHEFLDDAPDSLNVGLVVFAGEAQVATPPTKDHDLVRTATEEIDTFLIYGGTAIGDALQTAVELGKLATEEEPVEEEIALGSTRQLASRVLVQSDEDGEEREQGPVSILFLSDGAQTRGLLQPLEGAALAQEANIPVYTIALGTPNGSIPRGSLGTPFGGSPNDRIPVPPDPETLRQIADMTGGEFSEARTADALERAYSNLSSRLAREPGETEVTFVFIAIAAGLLLAAGFIGTVVAPRLP